MKDQEQNPPTRPFVNSKIAEDQTKALKREFIEPEISEPVDVLEATTFFQATDSGATN